LYLSIKQQVRFENEKQLQVAGGKHVAVNDGKEMVIKGGAQFWGPRFQILDPYYSGDPNKPTASLHTTYTSLQIPNCYTHILSTCSRSGRSMEVLLLSQKYR
jgi:hypothetical protein